MRQDLDIEKEQEIVNEAVGKRYGVLTIARRTGVNPEEVARTLQKHKIKWHSALKEWRNR